MPHFAENGASGSNPQRGINRPTVEGDHESGPRLTTSQPGNMSEARERAGGAFPAGAWTFTPFFHSGYGIGLGSGPCNKR